MDKDAKTGSFDRGATVRRELYLIVEGSPKYADFLRDLLTDSIPVNDYTRKIAEYYAVVSKIHELPNFVIQDGASYRLTEGSKDPLLEVFAQRKREGVEGTNMSTNPALNPIKEWVNSRETRDDLVGFVSSIQSWRVDFLRELLTNGSIPTSEENNKIAEFFGKFSKSYGYRVNLVETKNGSHGLMKGAIEPLRLALDE